MLSDLNSTWVFSRVTTTLPFCSSKCKSLFGLRTVSLSRGSYTIIKLINPHVVRQVKLASYLVHIFIDG